MITFLIIISLTLSPTPGHFKKIPWQSIQRVFCFNRINSTNCQTVQYNVQLHFSSHYPDLKENELVLTEYSRNSIKHGSKHAKHVPNLRFITAWLVAPSYLIEAYSMSSLPGCRPQIEMFVPFPNSHKATWKLCNSHHQPPFQKKLSCNLHHLFSFLCFYFPWLKTILLDPGR